jgi:hypothetical protein
VGPGITRAAQRVEAASIRGTGRVRRTQEQLKHYAAARRALPANRFPRVPAPEVACMGTRRAIRAANAVRGN